MNVSRLFFALDKATNAWSWASRSSNLKSVRWSDDLMLLFTFSPRQLELPLLDRRNRVSQFQTSAVHESLPTSEWATLLLSSSWCSIPSHCPWHYWLLEIRRNRVQSVWIQCPEPTFSISWFLGVLRFGVVLKKKWPSPSVDDRLKKSNDHTFGVSSSFVAVVILVSSSVPVALFDEKKLEILLPISIVKKREKIISSSSLKVRSIYWRRLISRPRSYSTDLLSSRRRIPSRWTRFLSKRRKEILRSTYAIKSHQRVVVQLKMSLHSFRFTCLVVFFIGRANTWDTYTKQIGLSQCTKIISANSKERLDSLLLPVIQGR